MGKTLKPDEKGRAPLKCGTCDAFVRYREDSDSDDGNALYECQCDSERVQGYRILSVSEYIERASEVLG